MDTRSPLRTSTSRLARVAIFLGITFASGFALTALGAQPQSPQAAVGKAHSLAVRSVAIEAMVASPPKALPKTAAPSPAAAPSALPKDWAAAGLDISKGKEVEGKWVQTLPSGLRVTMTIDPQVQGRMSALQAQYKLPYGGLVLLESATGRVLAMVGHARENQDTGRAFPREVAAPSASVYKVITAAALLEHTGISPTASVCYHGGRSSLSPKNIEGDRRLDTRCGTLSDAVAWSINSLIAKLAYTHLDLKTSNRWAHKFGFNQPIPFELEVGQSQAESLPDRHERARQAAGFWHTYISPLHGAMIAAAVDNQGVMMQPSLIERVEDAKGKVLLEFKPRRWRRVMKPSTAKTLHAMMKRTASVGTARKYFRHRKDFPRDITVGGKTGTLSRKTPSYLGYTWFVGFGQDDQRASRRVAVGGLVCNKPLWHIKGPWMASEAIRVYMAKKRQEDRQASR